MSEIPSPGRTRRPRLLTYLPSLVVVALIVALGSIGWFAFVQPAAARAEATPATGSLPTSVTITAMDWSFAVSLPAGNELAPNSTITVTFIDASPVTPHSFTMSSVQGVAIDQNQYGSDVNAYFQLHPFYASVGLSGSGQTNITFHSPPAGWYEFVCNVSGHFGLGMFNALGFGVPAPSNLTGGGSTIQVGWPVYVIAGTIVGLVVLALVLGFVSGQRKGGRHEMPPERLGYPEEAPAPPTGRSPAPVRAPPPGPPPTSP